MTEKRALQCAVAVLALVPMLAGLAGVVTGAGFLGLSTGAPVDVDSHVRFLSALFLAFGIAWYSCIPQIEEKTARFRLLAALTFCGGLGRLLSLVLAGWPSGGHIFGLGMELGVVPVLVLWQARIARRA